MTDGTANVEAIQVPAPIVGAKDFANEHLPGSKEFRPKSASVYALKVKDPKQVRTKRGTLELAPAGSYIVITGKVAKTLTVPPKFNNDGTRIPGEVRQVFEPEFEILSAEDFEELYDKA